MPRTPEPGYEDRVRESFARTALMDTFAGRLLRVAPGEVDVEVPFAPGLAQQHGFMHAGAITTVLDTAAGYAAYSLMPAGAGVLSIEFKVNLLAPAKGESVVARARVVRAGRTITVVGADAFAVDSGHETHVATMTATMMTIYGRDGISG